MATGGLATGGTFTPSAPAALPAASAPDTAYAAQVALLTAAALAPANPAAAGAAAPTAFSALPASLSLAPLPEMPRGMPSMRALAAASEDVPEPASLTLLGAGLLAAVAARRRPARG